MHSPVNIHGTPGALAAQTGRGPMSMVFKGTGEGFSSRIQQRRSDGVPFKGLNGLSLKVNGYRF